MGKINLAYYYVVVNFVDIVKGITLAIVDRTSADSNLEVYYVWGTWPEQIYKILRIVDLTRICYLRKVPVIRIV